MGRKRIKIYGVMDYAFFDTLRGTFKTLKEAIQYRNYLNTTGKAHMTGVVKFVNGEWTEEFSK